MLFGWGEGLPDTNGNLSPLIDFSFITFGSVPETTNTKQWG